MFTLKHELETLFVIILASFISLFIFNRYYRQNLQNILTPFIPSSSSTVQPIQTPVLPMSSTYSVASPDSSKNLILNKHQNKGQTSYAISVSTGTDKETKTIFSKTLDAGESISVPPNSWAPDNAFIFIDENLGTAKNYYVMSSSGNSLSNSLQYVNIKDLFSQKYQNYKLTDVTGWAGPGLLILNTNTLTGEKGPSFWLDVGSLSFIQLATRFD